MSGQLSCLSGHDLGVALSRLTVEIVQMSLNAGDTWTTISDRTLGLVRLVDLTGVSNHLELGYSKSLTALCRGDAYIRHLVSSSSFSWPFCIDIATL